VPRFQVIFGTSLKLLAQKLETCELGSYKMPTHTMRTRVNKRLDGGLCRLTATVQRTFAPCDLRQLRRCPSVCMGKVETMHCAKFSCLRQNKSQSSDSIVTFFFPFFLNASARTHEQSILARAHITCACCRRAGVYTRSSTHPVCWHNQGQFSESELNWQPVPAVTTRCHP
jgi:hypothetical protein